MTPKTALTSIDHGAILLVLMMELAKKLFKINLVLAAIVIALLLFSALVRAESILNNHVKGEIRVMVIDTGIAHNRKLDPYVQYDDNEHYHDRIGHGTHIAGIILFGDLDQNPDLEPACKNIKIFSCKFYDKDKQFASEINDPKLGEAERSTYCMNLALKNKIDIINFSANGPNFFLPEYEAIKKMQDEGMLVVTAAGNGNRLPSGENTGGFNVDYNPQFPASYATKVNLKTSGGDTVTFEPLYNVIPVGNLNNEGKPERTSNFGMKGIMQWERGVNIRSTSMYGDVDARMTGTSQATAMKTHNIIKSNCARIAKLSTEEFICLQPRMP